MMLMLAQLLLMVLIFVTMIWIAFVKMSELYYKNQSFSQVQLQIISDLEMIPLVKKWLKQLRVQPIFMTLSCLYRKVTIH
ncbi:ABC transporter ATP-binding protein [Streptococcus parauberis KRS-02109]|nr:ABC transporter ATP-binding protein [Streptococcus parauberis KRS-02109]